MITLGKTLSHQSRDCAISSRSTNLLTRAGYISQTGSGTVAWLALGMAVRRQVERIIREEMDELSDEISLGVLQRAELWERSGRADAFGAEMFSLLDRSGHQLVLSATAEEAFVEASRAAALSHRNLSLHGYQIGTKFRDEIRARAGLIRGREFLMKDGYSLHMDEADAARSYEQYRKAYRRIFQRCGLSTTEIEADTGAMGGRLSHEFLAACSDGDTEINGVAHAEIGHVFALGERYTRALESYVMGADGKRTHALMNCYGIGISRLIAVAAEAGADESGLRWAKEIAVADVHVLSVGESRREAAAQIAAELERAGKRVILDAREVRAGVALHDADLIGATHILTVGRDWEAGQIEWKERWSGTRQLVEASRVAKLL